MRQVISISLPLADVKEIKKNAIRRGFPSLSSYIKHLYTADQEDLISEDELLETMKLAHKEYKAGKYIVADSIVDLL